MSMRLEVTDDRRLPAVLAAVLPACLFAAGCAGRDAPAGAGAVGEPAGRVTFHAVPLQCSAAPGIGCGSRAKPILLELERGANVEEAWLNHAGTAVAIVCAACVTGPGRQDTLRAALGEHEVAVTELAGDERKQALKSFLSGSGWHRAGAVDRLSEEEAGIIAARLVRRVRARTPLTEAKAETLRSGIADSFKENFLRPADMPRRTAEEEREAFLEGAAGYLDEAELSLLRAAIASGYQPLPGEP